MLAVLGPLAGKLTDAESNDAKSWLPQSAESTQVLDKAGTLRLVQHDPRGHRLPARRRPDAGRPGRGRGRRRRSSARSTRSTARSPARSPRRTARRRRSSSRSTSARTAGTSRPTRSRACAPPREDGANGMNVYITGPGRPGRRLVQGVRGPGQHAAVLGRRRSSSSSCCSPTAARSCGSCPSSPRASRSPSRRPSSTCWPTHAGLTVNAQSAGILTVLVFGAGTDYALLLTARYREELRKHGDRHEAMAPGPAPRQPGDHRERRHGRDLDAGACSSPRSRPPRASARSRPSASSSPCSSCSRSCPRCWSPAAAGCSGRARPSSATRSRRSTASGPAWAPGSSAARAAPGWARSPS